MDPLQSWFLDRPLIFTLFLLIVVASVSKFDWKLLFCTCYANPLPIGFAFALLHHAMFRFCLATPLDVLTLSCYDIPCFCFSLRRHFMSCRTKPLLRLLRYVCLLANWTHDTGDICMLGTWYSYIFYTICLSQTYYLILWYFIYEILDA